MDMRIRLRLRRDGTAFVPNLPQASDPKAVPADGEAIDVVLTIKNVGLRRSLACYIGSAVRELYGVARFIGLDVGERRIGMAVSDVSGTLARPVGVVTVARLDASAVVAIRNAIAKHVDAEDGVGGIVVGLPRRLDGSPNALTPRVESFAAALGQSTGYSVHLQDERLTSREAESRLALREKDWRARKARLDAAAAAIILQDFLDAASSTSQAPHAVDPDADF
jgi:putative Holliday junction resolvase